MTYKENYPKNENTDNDIIKFNNHIKEADDVELDKPKIKKIPKNLRKEVIEYKNDGSTLKRLIFRLQNDTQFLRITVQIAFALLVLWIGVEFYIFVNWGESGGTSFYIDRPPGVEGFLPISALLSLKYWILTGIINDIHPSGLFILIAILLVGYFFKKGFCSWLCPIGLISESLWNFGRKIFGKNVKLPRFLDIPLRSLKYLLLGFFLWAIFITMDVVDLKAFIYSPYNKMADVKMYYFFANISSFAFWTIYILIILSVIIKNFWCRYLCPYGALLGLLGLISPLKISRKSQTCIDCELCTQVCPNSIKVHKQKFVFSDECTACLECIQACPVKDTLDLRTHITNKLVPNWVFATLIIGLFVGITGLAMITDNWENKISKEEYLKRFKELDSPLYQHNNGQVPSYGEND